MYKKKQISNVKGTRYKHGSCVVAPFISQLGEGPVLCMVSTICFFYCFLIHV